MLLSFVFASAVCPHLTVICLDIISHFFFGERRSSFVLSVLSFFLLLTVNIKLFTQQTTIFTDNPKALKRFLFSQQQSLIFITQKVVPAGIEPSTCLKQVSRRDNVLFTSTGIIRVNVCQCASVRSSSSISWYLMEVKRRCDALDGGS